MNSQCSGIKVGFKFRFLIEQVVLGDRFNAMRKKRHKKQIEFFLINASNYKGMLSA